MPSVETHGYGPRIEGRVDKIKRDEKDYFCYSKPGSEAVARKLVVMTELSDRFVTDRKLWRCLESCFEMKSS